MPADKIAHVTWSNPPVNALSLATRQQILSAVEAALADPEVAGLVLSGQGGRFSGGADVREFDGPDAGAFPSIVDIGRVLEAAQKPVVAAIEGIALGGGLELALFAHARVAEGGARLGLPEVTLGVLPGARGTQRLPRLIDGAQALEMMMQGRLVSGREAAEIGLVDAATEGDPKPEAEARARALVGTALPRLGDAPVRLGPDADAVLAQARASARKMRRGPAPEAIVDCVAAAATLPRAEAEAVEEAAFPRLAASPEAKALQHLFFAERAAARLADVAPDTRPLPVQRVGVVGAGTMGTGIALAFANAGFDVRLFDPGTGAMERSAAARAKTYASAVRRGRMTEAEADAAAARILPAASLADLAPSDLVVEAVIEDMAIKKQVLGELDGLIRPEALLATNTSFLDIDELAAATRHPGRVLGLHFFSPAQVMRLVEVVRAAATSDAALVTAMAVVRRLGKVGVVAGVCDGFIGNRMIDQYFLEACELLMQGATPRQVDDALRGFGMAMGPFAMSDMAGNDVSWFARKRRYAADPGFRFPEIADALAERGWFGQKTGQGWYLYPDGTREGVDSPDLAALLAACRAAAGIAPRRIGADEIAERCIYALVNEGAKLLDEGIAARASDIDVVYARGYGFPDLKGGPMHHAEAVGLARVLERVRSFGQGARFPLWEPARLLEDSAKAGRWAK